MIIKCIKDIEIIFSIFTFTFFFLKKKPIIAKIIFTK